MFEFNTKYLISILSCAFCVSSSLLCGQTGVVGVVSASQKAKTPANDALVPTPPMGWNSWNAFELKVNERLIQSMADAMVISGMRDAGYKYLIVDAGWKAMSRDSQGRLKSDPNRFPSGIKSLADYVHARGLKFGIYTDAGSEDCDQGGPGSNGHEVEDAATLAGWGVDLVKEDWCKTDGLNAREAYTRMSHAIRATGRPMVFSICEWGDNAPWLWAGSIANMWRTTGDNQACWDCGRETMNKPGGYPLGWTLILDAQPQYQKYAAPGRWNDPDMLQVGNPGLTIDESRAHFSLWAILAAPLIAGNDLCAMPPEIAEILLNKEVIAVDQDPFGIQGTRVHKDGNLEVWSKPLFDGSQAVVLFNRSNVESKISVRWSDLGLKRHGVMAVRDLWQHRNLGSMKGGYTSSVPIHGVVMIRIGGADGKRDREQ